MFKQYPPYIVGNWSNHFRLSLFGGADKIKNLDKVYRRALRRRNGLIHEKEKQGLSTAKILKDPAIQNLEKQLDRLIRAGRSILRERPTSNARNYPGEKVTKEELFHMIAELKESVDNFKEE